MTRFKPQVSNVKLGLIKVGFPVINPKIYYTLQAKDMNPYTKERFKIANKNPNIYTKKSLSHATENDHIIMKFWLKNNKLKF